jgi:hypothetical protein
MTVGSLSIYGATRLNSSIYKRDNLSAMTFLKPGICLGLTTNKQTAKDPHLMKLIRRLVIQALRFNIFFSARHIPGLRNIITDKLSRSQKLLIKF